MTNPQKTKNHMVLSSRSVDIPKVPNFLRLHGFDAPIPISEFSKEELEAVGRAWTIDLWRRSLEMKNVKA